LRGDQRRVAKQILNETDVHSMIDAMRCATVAQNVGVNARDAGAFCGFHDHAVDIRYCGSPFAAASVQHERSARNRGSAVELRAPVPW